MTEYQNCLLCGHRCGIDRTAGKVGVCRMSDRLFLSRAALHFWEEPIISGTRGSGTVFFSGCSLGCVFCQNREISRGVWGKEVSVEHLAEIFLNLQNDGAHNINLVTPTHFLPSIREGLILAKKKGLTLPIVYNTGSYDTVEALRSMEGLIDVYLPDFKFYRSETAAKLAHAENYPETARAAIAEMLRQVGNVQFGEDGMLRRGVVLRILLLPGHIAEAKLIVHELYSAYGNGIYLSLMNQYTPMPGMESPLDRPVTREEYRQLVDYADKLGVTNAFTQEEGTDRESFIPPFDYTGL